MAGLWAGMKIDRVIGPAMGAVVLAYELAYHLKAKFSFVERRDNILQLRRNFNIEKGEKILLCEDVITTGGTLMELIELLKAYEVKIVGVTSIINRTNKEYFNSLHFKSLLRLDFKTYEADECPMCKEGLPITIPGIKANKQKSSMMSEWENEQMGGWENEQMSGWEYEQMSGWENEQMSGWENEQMGRMSR